MRKRLILLLGMLLGSYVPVTAQTPAPQIVSAQDRIAPTMAIVRTLPAPSPAPSFPESANQSRQVSGTSDASKTQPRLIGS